MTASVGTTAPSTGWLGYLTYVDLPSLGAVGGLLIVDRRARPVEFHCSAPIQPTRTQEILYGQTLRSTLVCDQIGKSLVDQLDKLPELLMTDEPMALGLREFLDIPVGLFRSDHQVQLSTHAADSGVPSENFEFSGYQLKASASYAADADVICKSLAESVGVWDWMEPIERIHEAIREAYRAAA